jgi:hypothetical protein
MLDNQNQATNPADVRALTSRAEHGPQRGESEEQWRVSLTKELSSRPAQEQTAIAHAMQTMNDADRKKDPTLPKIEFDYTRATTAEDFKHPFGMYPNVAFTHSGQEYVTGMDVEKSPQSIFSKDKIPVFKGNPTELTDSGQKPEGALKDVQKDLNELAAKRDKLVAQLTPEQRVQYEKEKDAMTQWYKDVDIAPIAFKDHLPPTPLHDAIEALSNPHGLSDRQELEALIKHDQERPWEHHQFGTGLSKQAELSNR